MSEPTSLTLDADPDVLSDLHDRLVATRWPDDVGDDWERGTRPSALRTLLEFWRDEFDWSAVVDRLAAQQHLRVEVDGVGLHVWRGGTAGRPALLLVHGWPDSFLRFEDVVPLLAADFELFVPSIPGYGFSDRPTAPGMTPARVADMFAGALTALGIDRFGVHGGDLGAIVGEELALRHAGRLTGLHLTDVPYRHLFEADPDSLTEPEQEFLRAGMAWNQAEGAYAALQGTKPQTFAASLADSPAGLASWFLEKFRAWSDCGGDVYRRFTPERLATNATLYWVTNTAGSAARYYYEQMTATDGGKPGSRVEVPTGFASFPADIMPPPRAYVERFFPVERFTEMPRGGHFAAWEEPELLAGDLRAFFAGR